MYFRPERTAAALASAAGDRLIFLFQNGQHLLQNRRFSQHRLFPHRLIHLLRGSKADQRAGNGIGQYGSNQCAGREESRQKSCCIHLVHQKALGPENLFLRDPLQHAPLQQIAAALKHIYPGVLRPAQQRIIIMGSNSGKTNLSLRLQLRKRIQRTSLSKYLILVIVIHLMNKIQIRAGIQIFAGGLHSPVHFAAVIKPRFV